MKFHQKFNDILNINFNKVALHVAVDKGYIEIVKYLLANQNINVNVKSILFLIF